MDGWLSQLSGNLVALEGFLAFLAIGVLLLWSQRCVRVARLWLTATLTVYTIVSMPLFSAWATWALARGYVHFVPPVDEDIRAVVLLGAGSATALGAEQRLGILNEAGAGRVLEAARAYRALKSPWLISSGGARASRETSAATMKIALVHLGVPTERILLEPTSSNTYEEAVLVAPLLKRLGAERFVLVTSRSHMPRAEAVFKAQGVHPIPAVVPDANWARRWRPTIGPTMNGLTESGAVFHEFVGRAYYWWRGWI